MKLIKTFKNIFLFNITKRFNKIPILKLSKGDFFELNGKIMFAEDIGTSKKARSGSVLIKNQVPIHFNFH
jgi:hypothetical protein